MNKKAIIIAIVLVLASSGYSYYRYEQSNPLRGWKTYTNQDLGISFKYPPGFKVHQPDENGLRIDSDYADPQHSLVKISMSMTRNNTSRETMEQIKARNKPADPSYFLSGIKFIEDSITPQGQEEKLRQAQFLQKSNPKLYKIAYGDKTPRQVADEAVQAVKKQIQELKDMQNKTISYNVQNKGNYDLVRVEDSTIGLFHYILSDRGTFYISDTLEISIWKQQFEEAGVYQKYRNQFDQILDSVKIK